jgi:hypothetical protein
MNESGLFSLRVLLLSYLIEAIIVDEEKKMKCVFFFLFFFVFVYHLPSDGNMNHAVRDELTSNIIYLILLLVSNTNYANI